MALEKQLTRLYSLNLFAEKCGLKNMEALCKLFNHPHSKFKTVHVAGTNGKGSVTTKTAKGLESKYKKVGLYTSPHITHFNERIRINGEPIPDPELELLLNETLSVMDAHKIPATFFEITTLIAFLYFERQEVDIAVIEVGLGGRCDATNVILPVLTVITSISLEHTEILGNDILSIAKEKAGIQKTNIPMIIGPKVPKHAINGPVIQVQGEFKHYDEENNAIAKAVMQLLDLPSFVIEKALTVRPPCRFQIIESHGIPIIFDVAHNPDGLNRLFQALRERFGPIRFDVLCALSKAKAIKECLAEITPNTRHLTLTESTHQKAASLAAMAPFVPPNLSHKFYEDPSKAVQEALSYAIHKQSPLVICGTFYIMEAALGAVACYDSKSK